MNSIGEECNELKQSYDACFNVWFAEKFLRQGGVKKDQVQSAAANIQHHHHSSSSNNNSREVDDSMCKPIFLVYKECVRVSSTVDSA